MSRELNTVVISKEEYFDLWYDSSVWGEELKDVSSEYKESIMKSGFFNIDYSKEILRIASNNFINSFRIKAIGRFILNRIKLKTKYKEHK
jgi:hypothetical protein